MAESGLTFILQPKHVLFPRLQPVGPSKDCRGKEGWLAKGKGSKKAEKGVSGRGTKGAERESIVARAERILSSDLIKIYFLKTG